MLLLLAGCSSTSFFYNRLDYLISWYVDDYVDLNDGQDAVFEEELQVVLDWHRREELPRYVEFLTQLEAALLEGISHEEANRLFSQVEAASERLQITVLELLLNLGQTLSLAQRQAFLEQLREEQQELEEERLSRGDNEYREDAAERYEDNLEKFLGSLGDEQEVLITDAVQKLERLDRLWLADRAAWIATLEPILERNDDGWVDSVRAAVDARDELRPVAYREGIDRNTAISRELVRQVINARTARQDKRLRKRLREFQDEFSALAVAS